MTAATDPRTDPAAAGTGPILTVQGLRVSYGRTAVVHGVDLTVQPGEVVALVGGSGSGKSTVATAITGMLPAGGRIDDGRIRFAGRDLARATEKEFRQVRGSQIGHVPQDPMNSLNPVLRVGDQIAEVLRAHGAAGRAQAREAAVALLADAGLSEPAARARQYPHQLSGGMRQRVLIAMAFACRPRLVIADEPTSALDVTVQRRILDHIEEVRARHGTAVLMITHDLGVATDRADRVVVMNDGRVVEAGTSADVLLRPREDYTRRLVAAAPAAVRRPPVDGPDLLEVRGLTKDFALPRTAGGARSVRAVDGVSFGVPRGSTFAIVGESGSGKSTVARIVMGLERPTAGEVRLAGEPVSGTGRDRGRRLQMVYQSPYASLDPRFSVGRSIAEPLDGFRIGTRAERSARVRELLDQVGLPAATAAAHPRELSGGQRQRVAIARALAVRPEVVVLDEAVSALDVLIQAQILDLLRELQTGLGLTYLFISHDLGVVQQVSDRVLVMQHGRAVETGTAADVLTDPRTAYTRELVGAIPGRRLLTPADEDPR
ncbi:ABC transporter ATP-binding protein [Pseudonocardia kongjuensis]|uniref:ABC transporter ATP-binding protein n=1 Tax=Pseudonocardia kongjuensis TaxID=102227 RepID=A0ABP4IBS8_9PSEU